MFEPEELYLVYCCLGDHWIDKKEEFTQNNSGEIHCHKCVDKIIERVKNEYPHICTVCMGDGVVKKLLCPNCKSEWDGIECDACSFDTGFDPNWD